MLKKLIQRIEDVENALKFIDGPKDAAILKKLDKLEKRVKALEEKVKGK